MSYAVAMLSVHTSPLDSPGSTKDAGGMNVYMRELAKSLAQRQIQVDIYTRLTNEEIPSIVQVAPGVRVIHIKAGPVSPIHKHDLYYYLPQFTHNIEEFQRKEGVRYDVVHSHYWLSGVVAQQLTRQWDVPHVIMFHTLGKLKQIANPQESEPEQRIEWEQRLIQSADKIIASTADERMQMIRCCGATAKQIEIIPCGVDLELFSPHKRRVARQKLGLKTQGPLLLFAGRLDPFKGPDVLLRALSMMQVEAQALIVGGKLSKDPDLQKLQALTHELDLGSRVKFLGARPQHELPMLYSAADITVVPSFHESFGLAAVESLACGTPVVATRAGGLTTVVRNGETGYLVPRCPGFFAGRLDALLQDSELYIKMSGAARPSIMQFGWQRVAKQVDQLYSQLIREASCLVAQ